MGGRDSLEMDTQVLDAPDVPRETAETEKAEESPRAEVLDDPQRRREESAEARQRAEGNWDERPFKVDREELGRFDLKRAGLPDMSIESAAKYIEEHRAARPWLAMADRASPEARRIIAAMDAAGGHAHIRHEGWVSEEANRRRVAYREDPAQLDPQKRSQGVDGLRQDDQRHRSGEIATRITDPDAFATVFVRGVAHPKVRDALNTQFDSPNRPDRVAIPIAELLGSDGNGRCTGWQLKAVDDDMDKALRNRHDWLTKTAEGRDPGVPKPQAAPMPTLAGGDIVFAFTRNETEKRYEVVTIFPQPAEPQSTEDQPSQDELEEQRNGTVLLGASSGWPVRDAHRGRGELP
jgi:hypothetical protein